MWTRRSRCQAHTWGLMKSTSFASVPRARSRVMIAGHNQRELAPPAATISRARQANRCQVSAIDSFVAFGQLARQRSLAVSPQHLGAISQAGINAMHRFEENQRVRRIRQGAETLPPSGAARR